MPSHESLPDPARAVSALREQVAELERDVATLEQDRSREQAAATEAEQGAMAAVRAGNDLEAREHLLAHERHTDTLNRIGEELRMVTALIAACRETLAGIDSAAAGEVQ